MSRYTKALRQYQDPDNRPDEDEEDNAEINVQDFEIDKHALDEEWERQPRLYFAWAARLAEARRAWDETKAALEVTAAELDRDIRLHPANYGFEKVTEGLIEKTIQDQGRYQKARRRVIEAKHKVDVLDAAVSALDHKKRALEGLVQLHLAAYYATPRVRGGTENNGADPEEVMEEQVKQRIRRRGQQKRATTNERS